MTTGTIIIIYLAIAAPSLFVFAWLCKRAPWGEEIPGVGFRYTNPKSVDARPHSSKDGGSRACPKDIGPVATDDHSFHEPLNTSKDQ